jgi:hypothetical protein
LNFLLDNIISVELRNHFVFSSLVLRLLRACKVFKEELEHIQNKCLVRLQEKNVGLQKCSFKEIKFVPGYDFIVYVSLKDLIFCLRVNGYFHKIKNKPIGNIKLVSWGDYMIIKFYVFLIFAFLK